MRILLIGDIVGKPGRRIVCRSVRGLKQKHGINLVIAVGFARIFRQNMFNCGMLAVELAAEEIEDLFSDFSGTATEVETDVDKGLFTFRSGDREKKVFFSLSDFDRSLAEAGGWLEYADAKY